MPNVRPTLCACAAVTASLTLGAFPAMCQLPNKTAYSAGKNGYTTGHHASIPGHSPIIPDPVVAAQPGNRRAASDSAAEGRRIRDESATLQRINQQEGQPTEESQNGILDNHRGRTEVAAPQQAPAPG